LIIVVAGIMAVMPMMISSSGRPGQLANGPPSGSLHDGNSAFSAELSA
jgi:hypothetical protein